MANVELDVTRIPQGTNASFRRLVVGIDGSHGSVRALRWAARIAAPDGAEVVAAHVLTYSHQALRDITLDTMRTWRAELQRELDTTWIDGLSEAHVRHRCLLVEADTVAKGLLQVLEREHADLVVLGVHSRESLAGRLLSSTSHALAHHAQVPVVVVPDGWTA